MDRPVEAGKGAQQRVAMSTLPSPLSCSLTVASTHAISLAAWPTAHAPPTLTMRTCASSGESGGGGLGGGGEGGGGEDDHIKNNDKRKVQLLLGEQNSRTRI